MARLENHHLRRHASSRVLAANARARVCTTGLSNRVCYSACSSSRRTGPRHEQRTRPIPPLAGARPRTSSEEARVPCGRRNDGVPTACCIGSWPTSFRELAASQVQPPEAIEADIGPGLLHRFWKRESPNARRWPVTSTSAHPVGVPRLQERKSFLAETHRAEHTLHASRPT